MKIIDRFKAAAKAFKGEPVRAGSIEFGLDLKRCSECEYKQECESTELNTKCDKCEYLIDCIRDGKVVKSKYEEDKYLHFVPGWGEYCKLDGMKEM
jgi:hypothetical protein